MTALSRRDWLKTAAGSALLAGASAARAQCTDPMPPQWDETFDVVVIGSGFAGLAAAIEARLAGASVLNSRRLTLNLSRRRDNAQ